MADPFTLAAVGMAASAAGGGVAAFGKYQEGQATAEMYKYRTAVAAQNAAYEQAAGDVARQRSGLKTRWETGEAKVTQAAGNLDVNRGSAVDVRTSMHDVGLQEQGITTANYARRAYGFQEEGKLDVFAGKEAKIAGGIGAATSLISGVSNVSDKWMYGQSKGVFG